jgi:hypothetical protein
MRYRTAGKFSCSMEEKQHNKGKLPVVLSGKIVTLVKGFTITFHLIVATRLLLIKEIEMSYSNLENMELVSIRRFQITDNLFAIDLVFQP